MEQGFWEQLKKPFFVLAPMADVTDPAFRRIIAKYGKPDVTWTEFISADGLFLADYEGREKIKRDMEYSEAERPVVVQFFTAHPDMMRKAAKYAAELGFDGFDINMGCPDRSIEKQGCGAALMKNPKLAQELIQAAKDGIKESGKKIPVSVKTRIGYNKNTLEEWLPMLLKAEPAVITVHARTRKEMSKVPADWAQVKHAVEIRNDLKSETLILGNGDVTDLDDAQKKVDETGCDGVMLGRAIFGNPWLFGNLLDKNKKEVSIEERLNVMVEHTKLYEELLGDVKSFNIMKKHYKAYVSGWDGAKELRIKLMDAKDASEVEGVVLKYLKT
ncbi:tRNA dihydrouridine synthase [candidate division KSB1 bacterium]